MNSEMHSTRLRPKLMSFDVFGTLISVRDSSYGAFEGILADTGAHHLDVKAFWEHWEHRNIAHYWEPYRRYRDICAAIATDQGGAERLSETRLQLIRRFAAAACLAEAMEARLANGEQIDLAEHAQLASTLVRIARILPSFVAAISPRMM